jgi:hypothetical protein
MPPQSDKDKERGKKVVDFLKKLSKDASFKAEYDQDPDAVMKSAGLTEEEGKLILSGDRKKIADYVGPEQDRFIVWS